MQFLLENDPTFKPLLLKSSLGLHEIDNNVLEKSDIDDEMEKEGGDGSSCSSPRSPTPNLCQKPNFEKRKIDDLKEYLEERDEKFLKTMREIQDTNNKVLEKLIEKI